MQASDATPTTAALAPIAQDQRIDALDIVRGFALFGIFLMNVEWFTRPMAELGMGIDPKLHGADYTVSWLVYVLVQGKFWTLFSLLFGMGFAVMLGRAERSGRGFVAPYLRRILGLLLFGVVHFIVVWTGDILHNYAIAAAGLLLIVTRNWRVWLSLLSTVLAVGALLKSGATFVNAAFVLYVGVLMWVLRRGAPGRFVWLGALLYSLPMLAGLLGAGTMAAFSSHMPPETPAQSQKREEQSKKHEARRAEDTRIGTQAPFAEAVAYRAGRFVEDMPKAVGLCFLALPMFLIGFGFVRAGIVGDLLAHLGLLKRLAAWGIPLGLAMTLASVWLHAPTFTPADNRNPAALASMMLFSWASLPLSIGYFSAVAWLAQTQAGGRLLALLRPAGQMALSNYIGASVVGTLCFYGYGLGWWGQVSRPGQMLFVVVVFALQAVFSHFWLKKFRYGPLEWLWRSITYWRRQPLLRAG
ncbi:MAG: DUF418 domain-containing protein [Pseudoxanthomonas sp.]